MNLLQNFHLAVIKYLYRGRRAVPLQTFTTRYSNRKLSLVMALSTTFTEIIKFGKITQNKGHFAVQGHSMSPILVPVESSYTASYIKTIAKYCALSLEFMNLLGIYTVGVARSLCRHLLLDMVIVNCIWLCQPLLVLRNAPRKLPSLIKKK